MMMKEGERMGPGRKWREGGRGEIGGKGGWEGLNEKKKSPPK
jgi:hypothetical protein